MLAALVSQNLLEPTLDYGNKGENLIIFNLNRPTFPRQPANGPLSEAPESSKCPLQEAA
jgi:hypothetical protein